MTLNNGVSKIFFLTTLLLLSSLSPLLNEATVLEIQDTSNVSPLLHVTTFTSGQSSTSIQSDIGGSAVIGHQSGHRPLNASVDVEVLPYTSTGVWFDNMNNAATSGTLNNTSSITGGVRLPSVNSGPPGSGNNSTTLFSTVQWSGSHSYDTLELRCGIVSCGSIVASGSLTIMVRVLVIESGSSITASGLYSGGSSTGGSTVATTSANSDGAGGAGHGGSGGSGGGGSGGSGGSAYGNGTEDGSQGGSVTSSNHATANGGYGGGYIRIIADQIHLNGTILSNGEDGSNGQAIAGGSGPGGSGAGGGSGGSIELKANEVNIGMSGAIQADGGDGGDGASSFCTGACIGFFHGGDGGGGGGGGDG